MTTTEVERHGGDLAAEIEQVVVQGDLARLQPAQRVAYYNRVCDSVGLNPFTRPFQYINLSNKLTLYATKDCTEQLRRLHNVSLKIVARELLDGVGAYVVTAQAVLPSGRTDESVGAVTVTGLKGEALSNAMMKAETKAKRRVTLSICGLGWIDESEVESIPGSQRVDVDMATGEVATVGSGLSGNTADEGTPKPTTRRAPPTRRSQAAEPAKESDSAAALSPAALKRYLSEVAKATGYDAELLLPAVVREMTAGRTADVRDLTGQDEARSVFAGLREVEQGAVDVVSTFEGETESYTIRTKGQTAEAPAEPTGDGGEQGNLGDGFANDEDRF